MFSINSSKLPWSNVEFIILSTILFCNSSFSILPPYLTKSNNNHNKEREEDKDTCTKDFYDFNITLNIVEYNINLFEFVCEFGANKSSCWGTHKIDHEILMVPQDFIWHTKTCRHVNIFTINVTVFHMHTHTIIMEAPMDLIVKFPVMY